MPAAQKATKRTSNKVAVAAPREPQAVKKLMPPREIKSGMKPTSEELRRLIAKHSGTLSLKIDPDLATFLLSYNTGNRKLSERRAAQYAETMAQGRWLQTGEPLIFSREHVNTGQHRLRAVQLYGGTVTFDIRFGVERDAFVVTDTGRAHTASDVLGIRGVKSYALIAASLRLITVYEQGLPESANRGVSPDIINTALARFPDISTANELVNQFRWPSLMKTSVLVTTAWFALRVAGPERTSAFLKIVALGLTEKQTDAARMLRERLQADTTAKRKMGQVERLALCVKAWNAWNANKGLSHLRWRSAQTSADEPFPVVEGLTFEDTAIEPNS